MSDNFDGVPLEVADQDMHSRDQSRTVDEFMSPRHSFSADIVPKGGAGPLFGSPDRLKCKAKCARYESASRGAILPFAVVQ